MPRFEGMLTDLELTYMRWSYFIGQVGGAVKVYSAV